MSEPFTPTSSPPRKTVDELRFWARVAGCRPGRDVLILTRRAYEESEHLHHPDEVLGEDEDGYVWIDQRSRR